MTPAQWKTFYQDERARLGRAALEAMIERAPRVQRSVDAIVFPHTRAEITGHLVAAAARHVVEQGADEVLAIGVLHGAPSTIRKVHHPSDVTRDEFSLDAFEALLAIAAERAGKKTPRVHARYPLHVNADPASLEGIDEVSALAERMPVVATADPIHHGVGYGDAPDVPCDARASIDSQLRALASHDFAAFAEECARVRSDFRNAGPVLAWVLGRELTFDVCALELVDYTRALDAQPPNVGRGRARHGSLRRVSERHVLWRSGTDGSPLLNPTLHRLHPRRRVTDERGGCARRAARLEPLVVRHAVRRAGGNLRTLRLVDAKHQLPRLLSANAAHERVRADAVLPRRK